MFFIRKSAPSTGLSPGIWKFKFLSCLKSELNWVPVAYPFDPSCSGGNDQENGCLKPAQESSSRETTLKIFNTHTHTHTHTRAHTRTHTHTYRNKRSIRVSQMFECLPSKHEAWNSNPIRPSKKEEKWIEIIDTIHFDSIILISCIHKIFIFFLSLTMESVYLKNFSLY
jgi:hypothetical protein